MQTMVKVYAYERSVPKMWDLKIIDTDKPFYIAITEAMERDIKSGVLLPGDKLPSHRELAKIVGVNVATATRAYSEAEKRGLITGAIGSGTFIASNGNPLFTDTDSTSKEPDDSELIEMGRILPLYQVEPDMIPICKRALKQLSYFQHTPPQGLAAHRRVGAEWVSQFGICADENNMIVVPEARRTIDCILSSCFKPGDQIAIDFLAPPSIKTAVKRRGIKLVGVEADDKGMIPDELDTICAGHSVKGVYTSSCLQNPTNATMSNKRKEELSRVILKYDLMLIENDLYRFLYEGKGSPPLSSYVPQNSIYMSDTSKAFYAGLRIGFVVTPPKYYNRLCRAVAAFMPPPINAAIACECISGETASEIICLKREEIRKRAEVMAEMLKNYDYNYVPHSMFAWLKLPDRWSGTRLEEASRTNGIKIKTSNRFIVGDITLSDYVRISLSGATNITEFKKGLGILLDTLVSCKE